MDEIARQTPTFTGVSYTKLEELGSIQWQCMTAVRVSLSYGPADWQEPYGEHSKRSRWIAAVRAAE